VLEPNANPVARLALTGNKDNVVLALIGRPASTECDLRFFSAAAGYLDQVAAGIGKNRKLSIRPFESIFTT